MDKRYIKHVVEETGEVLQAIGKCERFGYDNVFHGHNLPNAEHLGREIGNLLEVIDRLGIDPEWINEGKRRKAKKLNRYGPGLDKA